MLSLLAVAAVAAAMPTPTEVAAPGPNGALAGTLIDPGGAAPAVLILPGSGPTDRDGNSPMGVTAAPYRLLAEALTAKGVATLRIDKRGMFGSKAAIPDPNAVTIADYAVDTHAWIDVLRRRTGRACVWVLGHSEGGLVALKAAQQPVGICGIILVSAPGKPVGETMRAQFRANPANAPFLDAALQAVASLEAGRHVDPASLPAPLPMIFPAAVQGFMIDMLAQKPAALAASLRVPVLVVQGDRDLQVGLDDARALASAPPHAELVILPGVNHVLKTVASNERNANLATYADSSLPVAPGVVNAIAQFVTAKR